MEDTVPQEGLPCKGFLDTSHPVGPLSSERSANEFGIVDDTKGLTSSKEEVSSHRIGTGQMFLKNNLNEQGLDIADTRVFQEPFQNKYDQNPDAGSATGLTFSLGTYTEAFMPVSEESQFYNMKHKRKGMAIIFYHGIFDVPDVPERNYTYADCLLLEETLKSEYDFQIRTYHDLTKRQICEKLDEASEEDYSDCDTIGIYVFTHGKPGKLYARDGLYNEEILWNKFTGDNCATLAGKPKLIYVEASRGSQFDPGVNLDNSNTPCTLPVMADFFTIYATQEDYYAWRNSDKGSPVISRLCEEIESKGGMDLLTVLAIVNRRVGTEYVLSCEEDYPDFHGTRIAMCVNNTATRSLKLHSPENIHSSLDPSAQAIADSLFYPINNLKKGKLIIFNHKSFDAKLRAKYRKNTQQDCEKLETTFRKKDFDVYVYEDRTEQEIKKILEKEDYTDYSWSVVAILTHGEKNGVLYSRDTRYEIKTIFEYFTADKCPTLVGKPKVFVFQACRGKKANPSIKLVGDLPYSIPANTDFININSCLDGYASRTCTIREFCHQLKELKTLNLDLMTLLTLVNKNVSSKYKQSMEIKSSLTRVLKLTPKENKNN